MECKSCQSEIDPKWTHAIEQNICPFCGQNILDEELQSLFSSMRDHMDELIEKFPSQLEDWLKSNYSYIKLDKLSQHQIKQQSRKRSNDNVRTETIDGEEYQVSGEVLQDESVTNEFVKNAGIEKLMSRQEKLRNYAKEIREKGSPMLLAGSGTSEENYFDPNAKADPEMLNELRGVFGGGEEEEEQQRIDYGGLDLEDESIPSAVLNMANRRNNGSGKQISDLEKLKRLTNKSKNAMRGGNGGFSRCE